MQEKCTQKPSRVPGVRHAACTRPPTRRADGHHERPGRPRAPSPRGCAGSRTQTAIAVASETRPVPANEGVQPTVCSSSVSGMVAMTLPAMPSMEVTDTASGNRRGAKSWAAKRTTLTNVIASPQPRMARASRAAG